MAVPEILQSTFGFVTMDLSSNHALATTRALTEICQYINCDFVFSHLKLWPLPSFIVKQRPSRSLYTQRISAKIAFCDQLIAKPSVNPLNLTNSIGFGDPAVTEVSRKTQYRQAVLDSQYQYQKENSTNIFLLFLHHGTAMI